ncbi:MAG: hypothetical protein LBI89_02605 [Prevotellaceae bacterium]|jgi:hypothetical protein|nr:hypothetical protein [Prevotellaceae bacterium]
MKHRVTLSSEFKHNPFVVPSNYFEEFVVRHGVTFDHKLKQNAFAVPDSYFDTLQERITARRTVARRQPAVWRGQPLRAQLAFAASFALLIATGYGIFSLLRPAVIAPDNNHAAFSPKYFSQFMDESALIHAVVNELEPETGKPKPVTVAVDNDAIIRYLADADVSLNDIAAIY